MKDRAGTEVPRVRSPSDAGLKELEVAVNACPVLSARPDCLRVRWGFGKQGEDRGPEVMEQTVTRVDLVRIGWRHVPRSMGPSSFTNCSTGIEYQPAF